MAQAYVQRLSFVTYLRQRVGLEPLIALTFAPVPLEAAEIERVLDGSLQERSRQWHAWATERFAAIPNGAGQASAYRSGTAIKYLPVCESSLASVMGPR